MRIQFFLRTPKTHEITQHSDIQEDTDRRILDKAAANDWDVALVEDNGVKTMYVAFEEPPYWRTIHTGFNSGLNFIP